MADDDKRAKLVFSTRVKYHQIKTEPGSIGLHVSFSDGLRFGDGNSQTDSLMLQLSHKDAMELLVALAVLQQSLGLELPKGELKFVPEKIDVH